MTRFLTRIIRARSSLLLITCLLIIGLSACGKRGDLRLPDVTALMETRHG